MNRRVVVTGIGFICGVGNNTAEVWQAHIGRRVRVRRADFDALLEASAIGEPKPASPSIWDGEIPLPVVPR